MRYRGTTWNLHRANDRDTIVSLYDVRVWRTFGFETRMSRREANEAAGLRKYPCSEVG